MGHREWHGVGRRGTASGDRGQPCPHPCHCHPPRVVAQMCHPPPCPQWEPALRGVTGDLRVATISRQPAGAAPDGVPRVLGWGHPWALPSILSPRVLPCPHAVPVLPGPGCGSPVASVSTPVPSQSREPLSVPRLLPSLSLSSPVSPGPGHESTSPCPCVPSPELYPLPGVSACPGCSLARDVPFPRLSLFPGCPLVQDVPFPGMSPFPGSPPFQGSPSARHVLLSREGSLPAVSPCPGLSCCRGIPFPATLPFPGLSLCPGCPFARGVTFPGMFPCPECPPEERVPSPRLSPCLG